MAHSIRVPASSAGVPISEPLPFDGVSPKLWQSANQRGQALIYGLIFLFACAISVLLLFNSTLLANTKTQLQNAADAAAYSAAVLQARDANFSAYTNRAMIANQVAVAQFVSLKSYLDDAKATHERMDGWYLTALKNVFPQSAPVWDAMKNVPIDTVADGYAKIAPTIVQSLDNLIGLFEWAQEAHHTATAANMLLVADDVIKKNDPQARLSTGLFMAGDALTRVTKWSDSTKQYTANDESKEADRFADVVVDKRTTDPFIRNRTSAPNAMWISTVKFCTSVPSITTFAFVHMGGTQLSKDKKRWLALDATQGFGGWYCYYPPYGVGSSLNELGGSGGAVAGKNGDYDSKNGYKNNPNISNGYGWALYTPATAVPAWIRYLSTGPGTTLDADGGLQDHYRDMADLSKQPPDQTPQNNGGAWPITVEVNRPMNNIRTSEKILPNSNQVQLQHQAKGNNMRALASAHAYFYRPKNDSSAFNRTGWSNGGKTEFMNLFSPYWQARLKPVPLAENSASLGAQ